MNINSSARKLIVGLVFVTIVFFSVKLYWDHLLTPANTTDKATRTFVVNRGESLASVADKLEGHGLIKSSLAFKQLAKTSGLAGRLQPGSFLLSPSMSAREVIEQLTVGVVDKWVTLLEGWRIEQMAEQLNADLGINSQEFIKVATEGYMFPDTYLFSPKITASEISQKLYFNFDQKYSPELKTKIRKVGLTPEQGIILASIVEREARSDEARAMVASILLKRYKIGMGLNVDATIQYALGYQPQEKNWWKRHLTATDLKIDSPFNTYLYKGLPPTPICNPSLSSLKAVALADSLTPYLYYYHDSQGKAHYSKTLKEHNQNVADYP